MGWDTCEESFGNNAEGVPQAVTMVWLAQRLYRCATFVCLTSGDLTVKLTGWSSSFAARFLARLLTVTDRRRSLSFALGSGQSGGFLQPLASGLCSFLADTK